MRTLLSHSRAFLVGLVLALGVAPAFAEDPVTPTEETAPIEMAWQEVITGQIQAFRDHDAPTALSYAGAGFQASFPDPQVFFVTIIGGGYAPIMESRSHTFGEYQLVGDDAVVQIVKLTGTDQTRYEALYQLTKEEAGWRVQGVQLNKAAGIGI